MWTWHIKGNLFIGEWVDNLKSGYNTYTFVDLNL